MIELLVVIVLVATLAAMLLPALNRARDTAKRMKCIEVLKTYSQAGLLYAGDYHDFWVPSSNPAWYTRLAFRRYIGASVEPLNEIQTRKDAFPVGMLCPDSNAVICDNKLAQYSYGMTVDHLIGGRQYALRLSRICYPALSANWMDALDSTVYGNAEYIDESGEHVRGGRRAYRHDGALNAGFFDGHAETLGKRAVEVRWGEPAWHFNCNFTER